MESSASTTHTIEVDEQVYDVLTRTAATKHTDINGALRYLMEAPAVPAAPASEDEEN